MSELTIDEYKELIFALIKNSNDINYVIAVYSFAESYPDQTAGSGYN